MKKITTKIPKFFLLPMLALVLISAGGPNLDGDGNSGGKGKGSNDSGPPCSTQNCLLTLYEGNLNVMDMPARLPSYPYFQPIVNIFNGQATSAPNLYENTDLNYCHITITALDCKGYGTKTYIWDDSNDGYSGDSSMNIEIPQNGSFTITIDLYECCGPYYSAYNPYRRAYWTHQATYYPTPAIAISEWIPMTANDC